MLIKLFFKFFSFYKKKKYIKKWRIRNSHNETVPKRLYPENLVEIGSYTYGCIDIDYYGMPDEHLSIGSFCSIASNVVFLTGGGHHLDRFVTFPLERKLSNIKEETSKGSIIIKDDVWIGYGAIILSGVTVGQGAVIGAKSIIAKDVPPYAVVVGNPAKIIKYRFTKPIINDLLSLDFVKLSRASKKEILDMYLTTISSESKMPNKFLI